ncbi:hypothetical protein DCAR_0519728 [Daucus carota subsp. sativus]|uniref:Uncharacterized protein n=1 Tax=Daucus carota subsp. sativus TaxID=79200 RepID=A0AAF0X4Y9_DAUCS|nr:hypothetical protein DCAR_0519728 [Daucus carota subsp. sativus]
MVREKVIVSTRTLQWKRFILSPLMKGQTDTMSISICRDLLGEIEGTCITSKR